MKHALLLVAILLAASFRISPTLAADVPRVAGRPNIVFFLVDDMGWQETSVPFHTEATDLNRRYRTPNMERLAAQGMKFTQAYASAVCSPTRVSALTGMNAARHRVTNWTLRKDISPDNPSPAIKPPAWNLNGICTNAAIDRTMQVTPLPALLRASGYRTIHVGKAHFGAKGTPGENPLNLGFDLNVAGHAAGGPGSYWGLKNFSAGWRTQPPDLIWDVPGLAAYHGQDIYLTEALTREAVKAVEKSVADRQPFYLYLAHYAVHAPWEKDDRFYPKYLAAGLKPFEATLASMIEGMDQSLGDLLGALDRLGVAENTIILFMSDNGSPSQCPPNLPLRGHKLTPYEGGIREPMIVKWAGVTTPGAVCREPLVIEDFFPTILELAGVDWRGKTIQPVDGVSFVPLLKGEGGTPAARAFVWHFPHNYGGQGPFSAVRQGPWKLIYHHASRLLELFNVDEDISEKRDLAKENGAKARELAGLLGERLRAENALMPTDLATGKTIEWPDQVAAKSSAPRAASLKDSGAAENIAGDFKDPPLRYHAWPLYWLNAPLDSNVLREQIQAMRDQAGFGGFAPLTLGAARPEYLTEEYFGRYGLLLELAEKLGLKVIFYDDINFPTGTAGGRLARQHPGSTLKNLRKVESKAAGSCLVESQVPQGTLMAAIAMETTTRQRVDLAGFIKDGLLAWPAPPGAWKIMFFVCVPESGFVDYLDPEAVKRWMALTYDQFARRFGRHFGTTIVQSFFDDAAMVYTSGGRTWTTAFNTKFKQKHGADPALLYPALWYDIGPDTEAARVALFGMRAELMSEGFVRTLHEWCAAHGIQVSGHPAGNYEPQPVEVSGDNIKFYQHCDIPLLDSIHYYGHGRDGFKLPTSAAFTYDRPVTAVEIYGNYPDSSVDKAMLYRSAMELYARGANLMIPHGMWYEPSKMHIPPEFSHRNPRFGAELPAYNQFVGRCSLMLQGGRHVADLAMLYPVVALQAAYQFDVPGLQQPNWGKDAPPEADYLKLSGRLTGQVRRDFTFLHPEILDQRCRVDGPILRLGNASNWEDYRVVIIPGGKVISWNNLRKIRAFWEQGGRVVGTTQLPFKSSEFGHDAEVQRTIAEMFGPAPAGAMAMSTQLPYHIRLEAAGSTIKTYVKGVLVDVTVDETFRKGTIGFRESNDERAGIARLKVTSLAGNILFQDDFSAGLGQWTNTQNASISHGWLTVGENHAMRSRAGAGWTDYVIEADLSTNDAPAGLVFRASEDGRNHYLWQFWPAQERLRPHKLVDGRYWVIKDVPCVDVDENVKPFVARSNARGGKAYFAANPTAGTLAAILDDALPIADVALENPPAANSGGGMLSYLHKVKDDAHLYYFANSSNDRVDAWVRLRGRHTLQRWDPHTGAMLPADCSHATEQGQEITRVRLLLEPVKSVFLTAARPPATAAAK